MSPVSLLTATLDLKLVQALRRAINSPGNATPSGLGPIPTFGPGAPIGGISPRPIHDPEPRFEPRPVFHPTPRFEPRPVHHTTPRIESSPPAIPSPLEPEMPRISPSPLTPPWAEPIWATLPPVTAPPVPRQTLKILLQPPDPSLKGSVFDTFI